MVARIGEDKDRAFIALASEALRKPFGHAFYGRWLGQSAAFADQGVLISPAFEIVTSDPSRRLPQMPISGRDDVISADAAGGNRRVNVSVESGKTSAPFHGDVIL